MKQEFERIKATACQITGVEPADLDTRSRKGLLPFTRYLIIWGLKRRLTITLSKAGSMVGYPEKNAHSSAIFGLQQLESYHKVRQHPQAALFALFQEAIGEQCCEYSGRVTKEGLEITGRKGLVAVYRYGWLKVTKNGSTLYDARFENKKLDQLATMLNHWNK